MNEDKSLQYPFFVKLILKSLFYLHAKFIPHLELQIRQNFLQRKDESGMKNQENIQRYRHTSKSVHFPNVCITLPMWTQYADIH